MGGHGSCGCRVCFKVTISEQQCVKADADCHLPAIRSSLAYIVCLTPFSFSVAAILQTMKKCMLLSDKITKTLTRQASIVPLCEDNAPQCQWVDDWRGLALTLWLQAKSIKPEPKTLTLS